MPSFWRNFANHTRLRHLVTRDASGVTYFLLSMSPTGILRKFPRISTLSILAKHNDTTLCKALTGPISLYVLLRTFDIAASVMMPNTVDALSLELRRTAVAMVYEDLDRQN